MKSSSPQVAPRLKHFAGDWTLSNQPIGGKAWTMEEKIGRAKKAGFQAYAAGVSAEVSELCQRHGMDYVCYIAGDTDGTIAALKTAQNMKVARFYIQFFDHDTAPKIAAAGWVKVEAFARELGLNVDLEVHRDTCTETPEKVDEIAELYQKKTGRKIRYCWDYSHLAVVKHLNPPYADRLLTRRDLVQQARQLHLRPFNGHHCQVPATNGKGKPSAEIAAYLEFVDALFACWFEGAKGGEVLYACPEFGPVSSGYGLGAFPDVWKDAIYLREKVEVLWQAHLRRWKNSARTKPGRR